MIGSLTIKSFQTKNQIIGSKRDIKTTHDEIMTLNITIYTENPHLLVSEVRVQHIFLCVSPIPTCLPSTTTCQTIFVLQDTSGTSSLPLLSSALHAYIPSCRNLTKPFNYSSTAPSWSTSLRGSFPKSNPTYI